MNLTAIKSLNELKFEGKISFSWVQEDKQVKEFRISDEKGNFAIVKQNGTYSENIKILVPKVEDRWSVSGKYLGLTEVNEYFDSESEANGRLYEYQRKSNGDTGLTVNKVSVQTDRIMNDEVPF